MRYEAPRIVSLHAFDSGAGRCQDGSGAQYNCRSGGTASVACDVGTAGVTGSCQTGDGIVYCAAGQFNEDQGCFGGGQAGSSGALLCDPGGGLTGPGQCGNGVSA